MTCTEEVRLYDREAEKLRAIADATGRDVEDVAAKLLRGTTFLCPECGGEFSATDVESTTVEEPDVMASAFGDFTRGSHGSERVTCPQCGASIRPSCVLA